MKRTKETPAFANADSLISIIRVDCFSNYFYTSVSSFFLICI